MSSSTPAGAAGKEPQIDHAERLVRQVHAAIAVDKKILSAARWRRNLVTGAAVGFNGARRAFASGSVAHGTVIHTVEDADGGVVLDRRRHSDLGPDGLNTGPASVVSEMAEFVHRELKADNPTLEFEIGRRAIKFTFNELVHGLDPYVDLIVGLERRDQPGLWIPRLWEDRWDASHPEKHTQLFTTDALADDPRVYRARLVRIGKAILKQEERPVLSSFHMGALVLLYIGDVSSLVEGLQRVFERGAADLAVGDTDDPARVSGPIKLEVERSRVVTRLGGIAQALAEAIAHRDDERAARAALAKVFPSYIDPPTGARKLEIASEMRRNLRGPAYTAGFGATAAAGKKPRSSGDAPA
jgi:hypothetical protein